MKKVITSFGSAFIKPDETLYSEIEAIGKYIAEAGYSVCSGGYYGSMEAISKGAKTAGGKTIGVTVNGWDTVPNNYIDEVAAMPNLMERIVELIGIADAYVIFKGGTGTLVEISVALELMHKRSMPEKRMIFYTDFWKNMIEILKQDSEKLKDMINRNVFFIDNPENIKDLF
ncbi:MAG TPA: LOG family protein [Ignavibacteria bacterium]|nr:LOG family protein [Ignavibacteria bacterium]HMR00597.1 LOG family protein [Ignavibacteria bacterium]